jgi:tetratricopeptide (TPR) repeat protein
MPYNPVDDLRKDIANGDVLVVVGTGVSLAATGEAVASWQGLLLNGVDRCEGLEHLSRSKAARLRAAIRWGNLDRLLDAAGEVRKALRGSDDSEVRIWLRDTVGQLKAKDRELLEAIRDLGLPIATTNYDDLLEEVTGWRPVTWMDGDRAIRASQGSEKAILHLHGHWSKLESVILDRESYDRIRSHDLAQTLLRSARTFKTLLFVGCGEGLSDPNFGALLEWAREVFRGMEGRHYRLCRKSEVATLKKLHREDHILPVSYGPEYDDLAGYLRTLAATKPAERPRLPGPPPRCFGREDELRTLVDSLLLPAPRPVPILGPPGVGKTTLSLEAIHDRRVKDKFGDRRFLVRCDGAKSKDALVTEIALSLGLESGPDLERRLFQELETNPAVLLLDNAETPWHSDTVAVEQFLTELSTSSGALLVASIRGDERPFGPRWSESIRVGPFGLPAARETFMDIAGSKFQNDPDLDRLLEAVERLPIAVSLLAHQAEGQPDLASVWKRWQDKRTALLKNADGKGRLNNFEVSLDFSLDSPRMTGEAMRLLSVLSMLPDGVAHQDLEALFPGEAGEAAAVLRKVGLAFDQGPRLRVLAPIREYVSRQHPPKDEDLARTVDRYLALARKGDQVGREGGAEAVARLVQELGNLDSMISKGLERSDPAAAILAARDLGKFVWISGWGSRDPLDKALAVARKGKDRSLEAKCLEMLGDIALYRSEHDAARARYEEALPLFRNVGDVLGEANCIWSLGDIALARSDHDAARARYEEALPLYRNVGDVLGEAICIARLGDIALARSDHDAAHARYEEALPLFRNVGSVLGEANCILSLGDIALARSDHDAARARYEEALPLFRNVGAVLGEANCIRSLGDIALRRSDHDAARGRFKEALGLYGRIPEPYSIGGTYRRLAKVEPVGSSERRRHVSAARDAWLSIQRPDLVERWLKEFGEDFEEEPPPRPSPADAGEGAPSRRRRGAGGPRGKKRRG